MTRILVLDDNILTALHRALESSGEGGNVPIVAIVDDDDNVGEVLRGLLELVGYSRMRLRQISCLVVDQRMPGITGLELLNQLRTRGFAIPSLLITGYHDDQIERQALDLGVMGVVDKPMPMGDVLRLVAVSGSAVPAAAGEPRMPYRERHQTAVEPWTD